MNPLLCNPTIFFIQRTVTRPLIRLKTVSEKITKGDFKQRVPINTQDEIGQLAQSFNSMADQLNRFLNGEPVWEMV